MLENANSIFVESNVVETKILSNLLLDKEVRHAIITKLNAFHFQAGVNRELFRMMCDIFKQYDKLDSSILRTYINDSESIIKKELLTKVDELELEFEQPESIDMYIDVLNKISKTNFLKKLLENSLEELNNNSVFSDIDSYLEKFQSNLLDIINSNVTNNLKPISEYINEFNKKQAIISQNKGKLTGTDTGFISLNKILNGFQPGELLILAARPSIGKTALAINFALNASLADVEKKKTIVIFSLEMSGDQLTQRLLSCSTRICYRNFQDGKIDDTHRYSWELKANELAETNILIDDRMESTILDIQAALRDISKTKEISLVIIDYLQLIQTNDKNHNRQQEVGKISRTLKMIAKELKVPVLAVAQLSRNIEQRSADDRKPKLSDLRESGSIEQDADVVMFLDYDRNQVDQKNSSDTNIKFSSNVVADLIIAKNRNGETGTIKLNFDKSTGRYDDNSSN